MADGLDGLFNRERIIKQIWDGLPTPNCLPSVCRREKVRRMISGWWSRWLGLDHELWSVRLVQILNLRFRRMAAGSPISRTYRDERRSIWSLALMAKQRAKSPLTVA